MGVKGHASWTSPILFWIGVRVWGLELEGQGLGVGVEGLRGWGLRFKAQNQKEGGLGLRVEG